MDLCNSFCSLCTLCEGHGPCCCTLPALVFPFLVTDAVMELVYNLCIRPPAHISSFLLLQIMLHILHGSCDCYQECL